MIEELKKTKASKLWFSMVVVFVVILNVSYVEAKSLKKGEEFKERAPENGAIRVVSSDEVEIEGGEQGPGIFLGKYTIDGERVRIVIGVLGTAMVTYYKITPDGLVEEKGGSIYYSKAVEEERRKAALAAGARKFKDNRNGTVTDNDTKLMWQKEDDSTERAWEPAISYCNGLSIGSYSDWRLPNIAELKSIIETRFKPTINTTYFPNTKSGMYWSSTMEPGGGWLKTPLMVNFSSGDSFGIVPGSNIYVRCVRSGQSEQTNISDMGKGADVNVKSNDGQMDLISAVQKGNTEIVKILLAKGADVNAKDNNGNAALIFAVENKNTEIIKMLLAKGADVNAKNDKGRPVLSWAVANENIEIVRMLLAKGVDVNAKDNNGNAVLIFAVETKNTEIIKMLVAKGADVNAKNSKGVPVLIWAVANENIDIVKMLLNKGADTNAKNKEDNTALIFAAHNRKNVEIVKMLLDKSADVNAKNNTGATAYSLAASWGYTEIVKMLLEKGADVKDINAALSFAASQGNTEIAKMLLNKGADVNAKNDKGRSVLISAVVNGDTELTKLLLEKGADVSMEESLGITVFDYTHNPKILEMLNKYKK